MKVTIEIIITKEYKLQIKIIDSDFEKEVDPCISFNGNFITIGEQNEKTIYFMKEWIQQPEQFILYTVKYQGKEYQLLPEVLFAIIISEFKQRTEKEHIIENTILKLPIENKKLLQRIKISLNAIDLKGIEIDEEEVIDYDYTQQGEFLHEILEKKETIEKQKRILERAKEINPLAEKKLDQINMNNENIVHDDNFELELSKSLTLKERNVMKLCQLDNYCIFIASRYFNSLDDHINLVKVSKRMRGNMEKFHYNGISVDKKSVKLFPNIETLHMYKEKDEYLEGGRIQRYVDWRKYSYYESEEIKRQNKGKVIEFKRLIWTKNDTNIEYNKQKPNDIWFFDFRLTIPEGVKEIEEDILNNSNYYNRLKELIIPTTIKSIPKKCVEKCEYLTNITLPLNKSQKIIGNKIFNIQSHLDQIVYLPQYIRNINGKEVYGLQMIIPTTVTSIDRYCFYKCDYLKQLIIPTTVKNIPMKTLINLPNLKELTVLQNVIIFQNKLFYDDNENWLKSIELPLSIKKVNGYETKTNKLLETYTIPTNVTKISDYCFANCEELTEIKGLENVKEIGKGCFLNCPKLNREEYPEVQKNVEDYLNETVKEDHQKQLEEWTSLKCKEILFDSILDDWSDKTSVFNERIIGKSKLMFLIEDEDGEIFGYYFNTRVEDNYDEYQSTDFKSFHFNLQSNGRLSNPMKFEIKDLKKGGIYLYEKSHDKLIRLGNIRLAKEMKKNESMYFEIIYHFDYHGIKNALCGKICDEKTFTPKRILVIQMK